MKTANTPNLSVCFSLAILASGLFLAPSIASGDPTLLDDTFSGNSVNTANWQVLLPFDNSSVVQGGGSVTVTNRGTLLSQVSFPDAININGTFTNYASSVSGWNETFQVVANSDGTVPVGNTYAERTGIHFYFTNDQMDILEYNADGTNSNLAQVFYSFNVGQSYNFDATIDGSSLSLSIVGGPTLTATDGYSAGGLIAIYGREGNDASTSLDSITVSSVPDSSETFGLLTLSLVGFVLFRRRFVR